MTHAERRERRLRAAEAVKRGGELVAVARAHGMDHATLLRACHEFRVETPKAARQRERVEQVEA